MRIIRILYVLPFGLLIIALICYAVPLPASMPQPWSGDRNLFAALVVLFFGLGSLVWLTLFTVRVVWRSAESLQTALTNRGFTLKKAAFYARHYRALIDGKPVDVTFRPAYRLEPWRTEVKIGAGFVTHMAIGNRKLLLSVQSLTRVSVYGKPLDALHIYAADHDTAKRFLAKSEVHNIIIAFLEQLGFVTGWELYLEPNQLRANIRTYQLNPEQVTAWLRSLLELAAAGKVY
jgi:hypothetical protein